MYLGPTTTHRGGVKGDIGTRQKKGLDFETLLADKWVKLTSYKLRKQWSKEDWKGVCGVGDYSPTTGTDGI